MAHEKPRVQINDGKLEIWQRGVGRPSRKNDIIIVEEIDMVDFLNDMSKAIEELRQEL